MPKFPDPPPATDLATVAPALFLVKRGTTLWRVYFAGGPHPTAWNTFRFYGPTNARFDQQLGPRGESTRGILYAARGWPTCFAEVFQELRTIDRARDTPALVAFALARPLTLLDLRGRWPTRAGASAAINSGPRPRARRWSAAIYAAYPKIDGVVYPSSMDGGKDAMAIYERAQDALPRAPSFHRLLNDPALTPRVQMAARVFGYALV